MGHRDMDRRGCRGHGSQRRPQSQPSSHREGGAAQLGPWRKRQDSDGTVNFIWDGQRVLQETDADDAAVIARYCRTHRPMAWTPPVPELRELQAFCRRLDQLQTMLQQERNRLSVPGITQAQRASLKKHCRSLQAHIASLQRQMHAHVAEHPSLAAQRDLLCSINGIGDKTALRKALFYPAMVATIHNPILRAFYRRLLEAGKTKMQAIGAVMHKLLKIAVAILRSGKPFDPDHRPSKP